MRNIKMNIKIKIEDITLKHPNITFLTMLVCMPISLLLAVSVSTLSIMLPIAWVCGWI
ncbi:MAG: hypothetical protein RRX92_05965 [Lachnospiraceae bacterium]